jgi:group I intron endonuclease
MAIGINKHSPKRHYVYLITNVLDGRVYVGKSNTYKNRWADHLAISRNKIKGKYYYLHRCIDTYGKINFNYEILEYFDSSEDAYERERQLIEKYNSTNHEFGMNLLSGGRHFNTHHPSTIEKMSKQRTGFKFTEESKKKMSDSHIGQIPGNRIINEEQVVWIKKYYYEERKYKKKALPIKEFLANKFCCSVAAINGILSGTNFSDIIVTKPKIEDGYKACSKCATIHSINMFNRQSNSDDGLCCRCKICEKEYTDQRPRIIAAKAKREEALMKKTLLPIGMKECTKCHNAKKLSQYGKCSHNNDGLNFHCKDCVEEWRFNNKVKLNVLNPPDPNKLKPKRKYNDQQIIDIRTYYYSQRLIARKVTDITKELSEKYNCPIGAMKGIVAGSSYKNIYVENSKQPDMKACPKCNLIKEAASFGPNKRSLDAVTQLCKDCKLLNGH